MSKPFQTIPGAGDGRDRIPTAYPPRAGARKLGRVGRVVAPDPALAESPPPLFASMGTAAKVKSWGGSAALHVAFLLVLAFWYFTPPTHRPVEFESRLGGSLDGVIDGTTFAGGLNTPEDELATAEASLTPEPLPLLDLATADAGKLAAPVRGAPRSAGGGAANDNLGAGDGSAFGAARFGDGSESIKGVQVKVGDPQLTLVWDNDVDLDLHVVEPGGKEIYWEDRKGNQGGELDVDNTRGYGPENVYWLTETDDPDGSKVKGDGPPGVYKWFVVYYGGFGGIAKPTQWQVRVKHAGRVSIVRGKLRSLDERSKVFSLTVDAGTTFPDGPLLPPERP